MPDGKHDCTDCHHCEWLEADSSDGWPDPNAGWVCNARHGVGNLKPFPFRKTNCGSFKPKNSP